MYQAKSTTSLVVWLDGL